MFQQLYERRPTLRGFVNNIMVHEVNFDAMQSQVSFSVPPLPEHGLFFCVTDRSDTKDISTNKGNTVFIHCGWFSYEPAYRDAGTKSFNDQSWLSAGRVVSLVGQTDE